MFSGNSTETSESLKKMIKNKNSISLFVHRISEDTIEIYKTGSGN